MIDQETTIDRPDARKERLQVTSMRNKARFRQLLRKFFLTEKGKKFLSGLEKSKGVGVAESVQRLIAKDITLGALVEELANEEKPLSYDTLTNNINLKLNALDLMDYLEAIEIDQNLDVVFVFLNETADGEAVKQFIEECHRFAQGTALLAQPDEFKTPPGEVEVNPQDMKFWIVVVSERSVTVPKIPEKPQTVTEPEPAASPEVAEPPAVDIGMDGVVRME